MHFDCVFVMWVVLYRCTCTALNSIALKMVLNNGTNCFQCIQRWLCKNVWLFFYAISLLAIPFAPQYCWDWQNFSKKRNVCGERYWTEILAYAVLTAQRAEMNLISSWLNSIFGFRIMIDRISLRTVEIIIWIRRQ